MSHSNSLKNPTLVCNVLRVKESEVKQVTRSMKWRLTELNKGQEISETFGVFNFSKKKQRKKFHNFCPSMLKVVESKISALLTLLY